MNIVISFKRNGFNYFSPSKYLLFSIIFFAVFVRVIFFNGLVFSDDSYYNYLSFELISGSYALDYSGYPIFLLRKLNTLLTSFSFVLFGYNETASVLFPFIYSLLSIFLIYKISYEIFNDTKISLIGAFLSAFFPVDIIFSTINFSDLGCVFILNIGIFFFIRALKSGKTYYYIFAGLCLSVSLLFKEYAYYYGLLLLFIFIYFLFVERKINWKYIVPHFVVGSFFLLEGLYYLLSVKDFFYRLNILESNLLYSYYDFFPYTLSIGEISARKYLAGLFEHIGNNFKYLLLRRYYLFLPVISVYQTFIMFMKKEKFFLLIWFVGILLLMLFMTISFSSYTPNELRRVWYVYPLIMPMCILTAAFFSKVKPAFLQIFLSIYLIGSIFMSIEFQRFFDLENKNRFKQFMKENKDNIIYTDHHTAYGLRLIRGFEKNENIRSISNLNALKIKKGELFVYSSLVIEELKKQKYSFPKLTDLESERFLKINSFGQFEIYENVK